MQYHNTLDALTFYQTSAECEALYRQCFAWAQWSLEREVRKAQLAGLPSSRLYIVSDCDETLLDNSAFNAWLLETGRDFHQSLWSQWCRTRQSKATPGALEFLHTADIYGVQIYYITSRLEADREATAENLQALNFPLPDSSADPARSRLFLDGTVIDGKATKKLQQFDYLQTLLGPPLLKLGDNLSDHEAKRYSSAVRFDQRVKNLDEDARRLGSEWILFPNPIYGSWRDSLRIRSGDADLAARDEILPAPYQPQPVRPSVTPAEAPKAGLLKLWAPPVAE